MNTNNIYIYSQIGDLAKKIDKLQRFLDRTDWNFTNKPRAYIGRHDDNRTDDFCYLNFFEGKDMNALFREQWRSLIKKFEAEIEELKGKLT